MDKFLINADASFFFRDVWACIERDPQCYLVTLAQAGGQILRMVSFKSWNFSIFIFSKIVIWCGFSSNESQQREKETWKEHECSVLKNLYYPFKCLYYVFFFFWVVFFFFFWCVIYNSKRYTYGANVRLITGYLLEHGINNWTKLIETPKILLFGELLCSDNLLAKNC